MWIIYTLSAALLQTFRNFFSKRISGSLGTGLASLCRFMFGVPLAGGVCLILHASGLRVSIVWVPFLLTCGGMALFQLLANIFLIELFKLKNFAVSMTLIKTETILIAVLGIFTLNEIPSGFGWFGIVLASAGLAVSGGAAQLSGRKTGASSAVHQLFSVSSLFALGAGASLAACTVFLKKTYGFISSDETFYEVIITLFTIMSIQTVFSLFFIPRGEWRNLRLVAKGPLKPFLVGAFSFAASVCWFSAFKLQIAAYVRTIGQVEFVFGLVVSLVMLKEKISIFELAGMACVVVGSALLFI